MWERSKRALSAAAVAGAVMLLAEAPALAHEGRNLGDLEMEVGWGTEPALAGQLNSALLLLVHHGEPVVDLGDSLEFEVTFGNQTQEFHFFGTIDGEEVDETFTPGPRGFEEVESPQSIQFPEQDPSTGELAERIDREVPRLTSSIGDVQAAANAMADDASSAKMLGFIGLVVGAVGLILAIVALAFSRRSRKAAV